MITIILAVDFLYAKRDVFQAFWILIIWRQNLLNFLELFELQPVYNGRFANYLTENRVNS